MPEVTALQALQFILILIALPLQLYLVQLAGNTTELSRAQTVKSIVESAKSYFTPSSWRKWLNEQLQSLIKGHKTSKEKKLYAKDECIAEEVFWYRSPNGHFGSSSKPRVPRPSSVKYRVGQVIKHKKYGYTGVIVGWDLTTKAPEQWIAANHRGFSHYRKQPNYAVLVDIRDRSEIQTTYVVEENLEVITNKEIKHPEIDDYFDFYDGAQYHMRSSMQQIYPYD